VLIVDQQFRITDHVDEQNVRDLELEIGINFSGHLASQRAGLRSVDYLKQSSHSSSANHKDASNGLMMKW